MTTLNVGGWFCGSPGTRHGSATAPAVALSCGVSTDSQSPLTIQSFQQTIRDHYYEADKERGTPGTWLWFSEEVGELARALARGGDRKNLEEEFADVLAWLCTLANINDIDLSKAVQRKYLDGDGPKEPK